jgi:hypothetical protein
MESSGPQTPSTAAPAGAAVLARPDGPVAAVMLATGIGTLVLGILTVLSEASEGIHEFLEFVERVGPLSGKTILASAAFFVSWGALHMALRDREIDLRPVLIATLALVAIALVLTFPPFFQLFKSE